MESVAEGVGRIVEDVNNIVEDVVYIAEGVDNRLYRQTNINTSHVLEISSGSNRTYLVALPSYSSKDRFIVFFPVGSNRRRSCYRFTTLFHRNRKGCSQPALLPASGKDGSFRQTALLPFHCDFKVATRLQAGDSSFAPYIRKSWPDVLIPERYREKNPVLSLEAAAL